MSDSANGSTDEQQALMAALGAVMEPLARLAVSRGLPYATLEQMLRLSVVREAQAAHPGQPPHRSVSRISATTGLNRREVGRLLELLAQPTPAQVRRAPAAELFTHWLTDASYRDAAGRPLVLPRLGPAPSFETLAQGVTRDVHPRSLLDELLRLNLATLDEDADTVQISQEGFVPTGDRVRMLGFLADNVGDHLKAGVDNVLGGERRHFEQAVYADDLSDAAIAATRALIAPQWKRLLETLVPPLEKAVAEGETLPVHQRRRIRVGLYAYDEPTGPAQAALRAVETSNPRAPMRRPRKKP
jgi:hypothetical protein